MGELGYSREEVVALKAKGVIEVLENEVRRT
jgi:hypothetical protein